MQQQNLLESIQIGFENLFNYTNVLVYVLLFSILFILNIFFARYFRVMSLWVGAKSKTFDFRFLFLGAVLPSLLFGSIIALLFSGPLFVLAAMPIFILGIISIASLGLFIITFSSMFNYFMSTNANDLLSIKNLYKPFLFLLIVQALPYIGLFFFYLAFSYSFGIITTYFWYSLTKN